MAKYLSQKIRAGAPDNHRWDGWCSWTFVPNNQNNYDLSSCEYLRHRTHWCVPAGITCAFVEVWVEAVKVLAYAVVQLLLLQDLVLMQTNI